MNWRNGLTSRPSRSNRRTAAREKLVEWRSFIAGVRDTSTPRVQDAEPGATRRGPDPFPGFERITPCRRSGRVRPNSRSAEEDFRVENENSGWEGVNSALSQFGLPASLSTDSRSLPPLMSRFVWRPTRPATSSSCGCCVHNCSRSGLSRTQCWCGRPSSAISTLTAELTFSSYAGAGLEQSKKFLRFNGSDDALSALDYIAKCESDFAGFSVERVLRVSMGILRGR